MALARALGLVLLCGCATAGGELDDEALGVDASVDDEADAAEVPADAGLADAAETPDAPAPDAPAPDAAPPTPPDATPPDACIPDWTQLLVNPDFELGATGWTQQGTVITAPPFTPHTAPTSARLGGVNGANHSLLQAVTIPAGATALRLRQFECFVTSDASGADDTYLAQIRDAAGVALYTLDSRTNLDVATVCGWTAATYDVPAALAGEQVQLYFEATNDGASPTSFVIDTLALEALACP